MIFTKKTKVIFKIFEVTATLDLIAIIFKIDILNLICKPLIIPALLGVYYFMSTHKNKWYILALVGSFLGDLFLLFSGSRYFMLGLSAFLVAHIGYILMVSKMLKKWHINDLLLSFIIFFGFLLGLLFVLKGHLGAMQIPVVIYGLALTTFGALALMNYLQQKSTAAKLLLVGASVFVVSDSLLAVNKFYKPLAAFAVLIMLTYIVAQYLIFKAVILTETKEAK
jgi:uncharacterized membrane protein YhhN